MEFSNFFAVCGAGRYFHLDYRCVECPPGNIPQIILVLPFQINPLKYHIQL